MTEISYKEAVELMIHKFGVEPDLDESTYRALAEEYDLEIVD